ncbi:hypothetical protein [Telluribacter sp. SYSU D00476]|uniref:hypothetical protein n=1 Tax=Telluribacter sp. SYSU D00476 TaxID=2811430 RepID=UPI001FF13AB1|nr:hypothetical protein [Telluribacter sp. SYSU D00476]
MVSVSAIAALVLALTHLLSERLKFTSIPRSKWLSFGGGVSVAYIFVHLLPELAAGQEVLQDQVLNFLEHHIYLIALFGLAFYYGLEKAAKQSAQSNRDEEETEMATHNLNVFWLHIASFSFYNAIIGYLLVQRDENVASLVWFTVAMAFHFMVNDYALAEHYHSAYRRQGRWVITFSIVAGWMIGILTEVPEEWIVVLFAFIAGSTILNVLKEELPEERKSNFWAFSTGVLLYSVLLLLI